MNKFLLLCLRVYMFSAPILIIVSSFVLGIQRTTVGFNRIYLYMLLGIILFWTFIYIISINSIKRKRRFFDFEEPDETEAGDEAEGVMDISNLHWTQCSGCERDGFYFSDLEEPAPRFLICWKCGKEISEVWCSRCGMGGPFIRKIASRPLSWKCPTCKTVYKLPENFYDQPIHLIAWENLPVGIRRSYMLEQKRSKIQEAGGIIYVFATLTISFLITWGYAKFVVRTFANPLAQVGVLLLVFTGSWYGLTAYGLIGRRLYIRIRNHSSKPILKFWE